MIPILIAILVLLAPSLARADAIIRTQAMLATTIVEYFIEEDRVDVALEIGMADVEAFRNLLPDAIHQRLGYGDAPLEERLETFFQRDFFIATEDGRPLLGLIAEMEPRDRVRRDEITGEALPDTAEAETVIFTRLVYPLAARPDTLVFGAPGTSAEIGFVAYHEKIPVNDFRYLGREYVLALDWDDPWYSQFTLRQLRRTYYAPMSGFLYVEPYEVRKEIIARPKDLQRWIDLGLEGREKIPVEMQDGMKRQVAAFLRERHPVLIDGEAVPGDLARIHFLERSLRTSRVIDPPVELDLDSAILGVIFVYPTDGLPDSVTMEWDMFDERIRIASVSAVDQAGPLPQYLDPDWPMLEWKNFLKNPILPTMTVIEEPPSLPARAASLARWPLILAAAAATGIAWRRAPARRGKSLAVASLLIATAISLFVVADRSALNEERAAGMVQGLLRNIYLAFDFREEEKIYDVLDRSVTGDLLTRTYLETRRSLELTGQGGARAKVKEVNLLEIDTSPGKEGGFVAEATWNVGGSVGHWGHIHTRTNQYKAQLDIRPVNGVWKLTGLEILLEERL
jgi:hypothetical protein